MGEEQASTMTTAIPRGEAPAVAAAAAAQGAATAPFCSQCNSIDDDHSATETEDLDAKINKKLETIQVEMSNVKACVCGSSNIGVWQSLCIESQKNPPKNLQALKKRQRCKNFIARKSAHFHNVPGVKNMDGVVVHCRGHIVARGGAMCAMCKMCDFALFCWFLLWWSRSGFC